MELEERVQKLERSGPQAAVEIHTAAQRVLAENVLLRSLLWDRGVMSAEVNTYLQISDGESQHAPSARVCLPNPIQNAMNLGTPLYLSGNLEARQQFHEARTATPSSNGHAVAQLSRSVCGPSSPRCAKGTGSDSQA